MMIGFRFGTAINCIDGRTQQKTELVGIRQKNLHKLKTLSARLGKSLFGYR